RETTEGRGGAIQCDEEGCEFRFVKTPGYTGPVRYPPTTDCLLQLRLRAGGTSTPESGVRLSPEFFDRVSGKQQEWEEFVSEHIGRLLKKHFDDRDRQTVEQYLGVKLDGEAWFKLKHMFYRASNDGW